MAGGFRAVNDLGAVRRELVMAGTLQAGGTPVIGKSILNRVELSRHTATCCQKIAHNPPANEAMHTTCLTTLRLVSTPLTVSCVEIAKEGSFGLLPQLLRASARRSDQSPASAGDHTNHDSGAVDQRHENVHELALR
ncbi:hypothetical protein ACVWZZ_005853 [Bradyrhizobium sp. LM6.10]